MPSSVRPKKNHFTLTRSCGPVFQASGTSGSSWRAVPSPSSRTISLWLALYPAPLMPGWQSSTGSSPTWLNLQFTSDIQLVPGQENVVADTLSRPSSSSSRPLADSPGLIAGACPDPTVVSWLARGKLCAPVFSQLLLQLLFRWRHFFMMVLNCFVTSQPAVFGLWFAKLEQTEKQQKMRLVVGSVVLIVGSVVVYVRIWLAGNWCYEKLLPFNPNCCVDPHMSNRSPIQYKHAA